MSFDVAHRIFGWISYTHVNINDMHVCIQKCVLNILGCEDVRCTSYLWMWGQWHPYIHACHLPHILTSSHPKMFKTHFWIHTCMSFMYRWVYDIHLCRTWISHIPHPSCTHPYMNSSDLWLWIPATHNLTSHNLTSKDVFYTYIHLPHIRRCSHHAPTHAYIHTHTPDCCPWGWKSLVRAHPKRTQATQQRSRSLLWRFCSTVHMSLPLCVCVCVCVCFYVCVCARISTGGKCKVFV